MVLYSYDFWTFMRFFRHLASIFYIIDEIILITSYNR